MPSVSGFLVQLPHSEHCETNTQKYAMIFIQTELAKVKAEKPGVAHKEVGRFEDLACFFFLSKENGLLTHTHSLFLRGLS